MKIYSNFYIALFKYLINFSFCDINLLKHLHRYIYLIFTIYILLVLWNLHWIIYCLESFKDRPAILNVDKKVFILSILPATISTGWFSLNLTVSCSTNNRNKSLTFFNNLRFAKRIQTNAVVSQGFLKRNFSSFMGTEDFNIAISYIREWSKFSKAKASWYKSSVMIFTWRRMKELYLFKS